MDEKLKIHDTCGVHNLHGMPGVLAGLVGVLMAGIATEDQYHQSLYHIFPARAAENATPTSEHTFIRSGDGRTALQQSGYQALALIVTIAIALISGFVTGTFPRSNRHSFLHSLTYNGINNPVIYSI